MKISSISVSNFKSYRDETISFGDLNILIGSNASGKSNTINILRFIDHIVDYGIENAISLSGGIEYVLNTSIGKSKPLSIAFSFDCEEENWIRYVDRKQDISLLLAGFDYQFQITPHKRGSGFTITQDSLCLKCYQVLDFVKGEKCITAADKQYMIRYRRSGNRVVADIKNDTDFLHSEDLRSGLDSDFITRYLSEQEHRKELILHFIMLFMPPMFYSRDLIRIYDFDPKLIPVHKNARQSGSLVVPTILLGQFIGAEIDELLSHRGLFLAPRLPDNTEPHCCQQAGRAAVEPQCFLPAAMSVLWSQRMTVDALRPSGTDPLELFRSQFRQAQGANDSASIPLYAPFL